MLPYTGCSLKEDFTRGWDTSKIVGELPASREKFTCSSCISRVTCPDCFRRSFSIVFSRTNLSAKQSFGIRHKEKIACTLSVPKTTTQYGLLSQASIRKYFTRKIMAHQIIKV